MINITQKQAIKRYDTLPEPLKEALWSPYLTSIINQATNGLGEELVLGVNILIGDVLMGFSLPDDFGKNLKEAIEIDPKKADEISEEINKKIFLPLKAEIEKNYNPTISEKAEEESQPTPLEAVAQEVSGIKPIKIETGESAKTAASAPITVKPLAEQPSFPAEQSKKTEEAEPAPIPLEPMVMREEKISPLQRAVNLGDFQIELPQTKKPIASAIAAEFEMGDRLVPPSKTTAPKSEIPRVVHYSAYKTNLSEIAGKPSQTVAVESASKDQTINKNAFGKLQEKSAPTPAPLADNPIIKTEKNTIASPVSQEKTKDDQQKSPAKFINLNNLGITIESPAPVKNISDGSGPELKGNTIDLSK